MNFSPTQTNMTPQTKHARRLILVLDCMNQFGVQLGKSIFTKHST